MLPKRLRQIETVAMLPGLLMLEIALVMAGRSVSFCVAAFRAG